MAAEGNKRAKLVLKLSDKFDNLLTTILVGNNIVNILSSSLATALFCLYFPKNGIAISTAVMTIVVVSEMFGLQSLRTVAIPMAFGLISGGISSLCISGPLWVIWKRRKAKKA